jgi:hypothetical protein
MSLYDFHVLCFLSLRGGVEYKKATNWEERQRCTGKRWGEFRVDFFVRRGDGVAYYTLEGNTQIP